MISPCGLNLLAVLQELGQNPQKKKGGEVKEAGLGSSPTFPTSAPLRQQLRPGSS